MKKIPILILLGILTFLSLPTLVQTTSTRESQVIPDPAEIRYGLRPFLAARPGLGARANIYFVINDIITALLGLLGVIAVIIILYAGFTWMTAAGSEEKIRKAKGLLRNGVVGLTIIILSYAIARFVICLLSEAVVGVVCPPIGG